MRKERPAASRLTIAAGATDNLRHEVQDILNFLAKEIDQYDGSKHLLADARLARAVACGEALMPLPSPHAHMASIHAVPTRIETAYSKHKCVS